MTPTYFVVKCAGCGIARKWKDWECLTWCDCLADNYESLKALNARIQEIPYVKESIENERKNFDET